LNGRQKRHGNGNYGHGCKLVHAEARRRGEREGVRSIDNCLGDVMRGCSSRSRSFLRGPAAPRDIVRHFEPEQVSRSLDEKSWAASITAFLTINRRQFAYEVTAFARHRFPGSAT